MGNYGTIITISQNSIAHSGQQSTAEQFITCHLVSSRDDPPCHKAEDIGDGPLVSARYGWQPPPPPPQHALVPSLVLLLLDQEHLIIQISGSLTVPITPMSSLGGNMGLKGKSQQSSKSFRSLVI